MVLAQTADGESEKKKHSVAKSSAGHHPGEVVAVLQATNNGGLACKGSASGDDRSGEIGYKVKRDKSWRRAGLRG